MFTQEAAATQQGFSAISNLFSSMFIAIGNYAGGHGAPAENIASVYGGVIFPEKERRPAHYPETTVD